jgi:hypothetical protein
MLKAFSKIVPHSILRVANVSLAEKSLNKFLKSAPNQRSFDRSIFVNLPRCNPFLMQIQWSRVLGSKKAIGIGLQRVGAVTSSECAIAIYIPGTLHSSADCCRNDTEDWSATVSRPFRDAAHNSVQIFRLRQSMPSQLNSL